MRQFYHLQICGRAGWHYIFIRMIDNQSRNLVQQRQTIHASATVCAEVFLRLGKKEANFFPIAKKVINAES